MYTQLDAGVLEHGIVNTRYVNLQITTFRDSGLSKGGPETNCYKVGTTVSTVRRETKHYFERQVIIRLLYLFWTQ